MTWRRLEHALRAATVAWAAGFLCIATPASALSVELKDVAPDRIERQKRTNDGTLPLPGTPDVRQLNDRLAAKGLKSGAPMLIRIFKAQSELEIWMEKDGSYELFATYPICHWSGTLGPKQREGDKQTPEGFYTITSRQLHRMGRWQRALNLGFPNVYDEAHERNGSYILVHGGCSSVGCFAMTNPGIDEIYQLTSASLRAGQRFIPVHVFPFRMTEANLIEHGRAEWIDFWMNLKEGFDSFERTRRPPRVSVCDNRYIIQDATSPAEAGLPSPLAACGPTAARIHTLELSGAFVPHPRALSRLNPQAPLRRALQSLSMRSALLLADPRPGSFAAVMGRESGDRPGTQTDGTSVGVADSGPHYACTRARASCRKFIALQERKFAIERRAARKLASQAAPRNKLARASAGPR